MGDFRSQPEIGAARQNLASRIIHDARKVYEDHVGDGAWLAMERAYFDLICAALSQPQGADTREAKPIHNPYPHWDGDAGGGP